MATRPKYPYPIPELIQHLELAQAETQDRDHLYANLARLLKICHATMQHAQEIWQSGRLQGRYAEFAAADAMQYGLGRLVPLIIDHTPAGWPGLLNYIEQPEKYAWYNPVRDRQILPALQVKDEEEQIIDQAL